MQGARPILRQAQDEENSFALSLSKGPLRKTVPAPKRCPERDATNRIVCVRNFSQPPPCGEVEKRPSRFSGGGRRLSMARPRSHPKLARDARKFRPPRKGEVKSKRRCNMANLQIDPGRAT